MGLKPLEFSDCYLDSPYFRENVYEHERELEKTNERIKGLIKECRNLLKAIDSELNDFLLLGQSCRDWMWALPDLMDLWIFRLGCRSRVEILSR